MGTSISPKLNGMINKFEHKWSSHDGKLLLEKTNKWFEGHTTNLKIHYNIMEVTTISNIHDPKVAIYTKTYLHYPGVAPTQLDSSTSWISLMYGYSICLTPQQCLIVVG